MKKALLIIILAAGFQQLKAQQSLKPLPDMKLSDGLSNNFFKPKTYNPLAPYIGLNPDSARIAARPDQNDIVIYSMMPIAKITYSNIDHMPIYNPCGSDMHYALLIKKVEINPVVPVDKTTP